MVNVAITGAGRGIGLELVKQYTLAGDRVFALCRDPAGASELRSIADGSNGKVTVHTFDVADDDSVKAGAADTGGGKVDVLLNVAGIVGGPTAPRKDLAAPRRGGVVPHVRDRLIRIGEPARALLIRDRQTHRAVPELCQVFDDPPISHRPTRQPFDARGVDQAKVGRVRRSGEKMTEI